MKSKEEQKRVKGVHDDRRRPSTKDINRPEVFIMLEGVNRDTADRGGFYTLQVKQKARANRLVGTEYCSRGYSHSTPGYTGKACEGDDKTSPNTLGPEIEQHAPAAEPSSTGVSMCMQRTGRKKPDKTVRD
jgi:hypothetical protein